MRPHANTNARQLTLLPRGGPPCIVPLEGEGGRLALARVAARKGRRADFVAPLARPRFPLRLSAPQLDAALLFVRDQALPNGLDRRDRQALGDFARHWPLPALTAGLWNAKRAGSPARSLPPDAKKSRPDALLSLPARYAISGGWQHPPAAVDKRAVDARGQTVLFDVAALSWLDEESPLAFLLGLHGGWQQLRPGGRPRINLSADSLRHIGEFAATGALPAGLTPLARGSLARDARYAGLEALAVESEVLYPLRQQALARLAGSSRTDAACSLLRLGDALGAHGARAEAHQCWRRALIHAEPHALLAALAQQSRREGATTAERADADAHARTIRLLRGGLPEAVWGPLPPGPEAQWTGEIRRLHAFAACLAGNGPRLRRMMRDVQAFPAAPPPSPRAGPTMAEWQAAIELAQAHQREPAALLFLAEVEGRLDVDFRPVDSPLIALVKTFPNSARGQWLLAHSSQVDAGEPEAVAALQKSVRRSPKSRPAFLAALWPALLAANWQMVAALAKARLRLFPDELGAAVLALAARPDGGQAHERDAMARRVAAASPSESLACVAMAWAFARADDVEATVDWATCMADGIANSALTTDDFPELWRAAARALVAVGERPQAVALLEEACDWHGEDWPLFEDLCRFARDSGRPSRALEASTRLAEHFDDHLGRQQAHFELLLEAPAIQRAVHFFATAPAPLRTTENRVALARGLRLAGQLDRAAAALEHALVGAPDHVGAQRERAHIALATGDSAMGRSALAQVRSLGGYDGPSRLVHVKLLLAEGENSAAISACEALIAEFPAFRAPFFVLAHLYERMGRSADFPAFTRSLPGPRPAAQLSLATWHYRRGAHAESLALTGELDVEGQDDLAAMVHLTRAANFLATSQNALALPGARAAATAVRPPRHAALVYGLSLFRLGHTSSSIRWLEEAAHIENRPATWTLLGEVHCRLGDLYAGIGKFQIALAQEDRDSWTHHLLAQAWLALEEHTKVMVHGQRAEMLGLHPAARAVNRAAMACAQVALRPADDATSAALQAAFRHGYRSGELMSAAGRLALFHGHLGSARLWLQAALALTPRLPEAHEQLARLSALEGRSVEAARHWAQAAGARPLCAWTRQMAAEAHDAIGEREQAARFRASAFVLARAPSDGDSDSDAA